MKDKLGLGNLGRPARLGLLRRLRRSDVAHAAQDTPDDYVIATGISHSVKELVEIAFAHVDLDWQKHVELDPAFLRPAEVDHLLGDRTKAKKKLAGNQRSTSGACSDDGRRRHRAPQRRRACRGGEAIVH